MRYLLLLLLFTGLTSYAQIELVKDINPDGPGIGGADLVEYNGELYFSGKEDLTNRELWKSDGTETGTVQVIDLRTSGGSRPENLTVTNNYIYFTALAISATGQEVLVRSDGTAAGTLILFDGNGDPYEIIDEPIAINDKLFFVRNAPTGSPFGNELFVLLDGENQALRLTDFESGSASSTFRDPVAFDGKLYFDSRAEADNAGLELYVSDGTAAGTKLVKDLNPGTAGSNPSDFRAVGNVFYFQATDANGTELWKSDGTATGTVLVKDINPGSADSNPKEFTGTSDGKVFFTATDGAAGGELFVTDGTEPGTRLVKDIRSGEFGSSIDQLTSLGNNVVFSAFTSENGVELYISDGTNGGTQLLKDINPGTSSSVGFSNLEWLVYEGKLYFPAEDATTGIELWQSDGTTGGTKITSDFNPGAADSGPDELIFYNDRLYFFASGPDGKELHRYLPSDPCDGITCPLGDVCVDGTCLTPDPCENVNCAEGEVCENGNCVSTDPCGEVSCPLGEICTDGTCVEPCGETNCLEGETCLDGTCVPDDPCDGISCPLGQVCFDGSCYNPNSSGRVFDQDGNPLSDVLVLNLSTNQSIQTDGGGRYITSVGDINFSKPGYISQTLRMDGLSKNIIMQRATCQNIVCPLGEVCFLDECRNPNEVVSVTLTINSPDGSPLSGIEVFLVDEPEQKELTDENGLVSVPIAISGLHANFLLRIEDPNGLYNSRTYLPETNLDEVVLTRLSCEGVTCPLGDVCYEGSCYEPVTNAVQGYVFNTDSLAIPDALVEISSGATFRTNTNGYFSLNLDVNIDQIELTISKQGMGVTQQIVAVNSITDIYLFGNEPCFGTVCPLGQVCYEGSCWDPTDEPDQTMCDGVDCPLGQVCYEGSCYEPCDLPGLCIDELSADACDKVTCPLGQVCFEGSCYDPCVEGGENCYNNDPDPCANISAPPGYVCLNGVVVPDCPSNTLACANATTDICSIVSCPPGDICFSCTDPTGANTSGTSSISGTLNLENLNSGGRVASTQNENIFIYLVETATGRKTAIDVTDADGNFAYENVPAGTYEIFMTARGYFFSQDQQQLVVEQDDDIILSIFSKDRFVTVERSRVTGLVPPNFQYPTSWFPIPNTGSIFFIEETGIQNLSIYTLQGRKVNREKSFEIKNGRTELQLDQPLPQGFYILQWNSTATENFQTQTVIISR